VVTTVNLRMTKTVAAVVATGAASYQVNYDIDVVNVGGSAATYTLTDTLGFPNSGVVFIGNAQVATTGGTLNPALPGGQFAPMNGTIEQLSANGVNLAVGATHLHGERARRRAAGFADGRRLYGRGGSRLLQRSLARWHVEPGQRSLRADRRQRAADPPRQDGLARHGRQRQPLRRCRRRARLPVRDQQPGTLPLSAVQLFDPRIESLTCDPLTANGVAFRVIPGDEIFFGPFNAPPNGTLPPGDSVACWGSYTLTADDVARRRVVNSATATGNAPGGQAVSSVSTAIFVQFR
jgi:hypothetical protein